MTRCHKCTRTHDTRLAWFPTCREIKRRSDSKNRAPLTFRDQQMRRKLFRCAFLIHGEVTRAPKGVLT